jgi:hypothetical protein
MRAPNATTVPSSTNTGIAPWNRVMFTAVVVWAAKYISVLKAVKPSAPMTRIERQRGASSGHASRSGWRMIGSRMRQTPTQRIVVSASGET